MIIACPECTSPFEVADGHIAPLVQVECPTCSFRMILDFEAANDASLREEGMAMTQGFFDEASYRLAVGAGHVVYSGPGASTSAPERPSLRAVPAEPEPTPLIEPTPVAGPVAPEPTLDKPPVRQPPVEPPIEKPPIRQPIVEEPQLELESPVESALDKPPVRHPPERRARATLIAHTPPPPHPVLAQPEPPTEPTPVEAQVTAPARSDADHDNLDMDVDVDEPEVVAPATPEVPRPEPTVTTSKPSTPDESADEDSGKDTGKRSSARTVVTLLLLLILLAVGGAMVWSLVTTGHPYQKLLEISGLAAPQDDAEANDKGDAKANGKANAKSDEQADG